MPTKIRPTRDRVPKPQVYNLPDGRTTKSLRRYRKEMQFCLDGAQVLDLLKYVSQHERVLAMYHNAVDRLIAANAKNMPVAKEEPSE